MDASTRRDGRVPNKGKMHFLPRQISTPSELWGLLCSRGRGARNKYGDDSFDYRYNNGKSARFGRARRGHSDTQGCYLGFRVETYLYSTINGKKAVTREEKVAEGHVYSQFFDT
jgi:hypothetical protein